MLVLLPLMLQNNDLILDINICVESFLEKKNIMPHDFMHTVYLAIAKAVNVCCSINVVSK